MEMDRCKLIVICVVPRSTLDDEWHDPGDPWWDEYEAGDHVVHAAFGKGVVTSDELDGTVTVRFASDGSVRQLVADIAPLRYNDERD